MEKTEKAKKKRLKVHFTRKNLIGLSIAFLYCLTNVISCLFITPNSIFGKKNAIYLFATNVLSLPSITSYYANWVMVGLFNVFLFLAICSFVFIKRTAVYYEDNATDKKYLIAYFLTGFICLAFWLGISLICLYPFEGESVGTSFTFFGEMLLIGGIVFIILFLTASSIVAIYINFRHIDEPYRFIDYSRDEDEALKDDENGKTSLLSVLSKDEADSSETEEGGTLVSSGAYGVSGGAGYAEIGETKLGDAQKVFPGLSTIDKNELEDIKVPFPEIKGLTLKKLAENFRNYLAKNEKLYYDPLTIRAFIAGLGTSRLIILEGLSGTGKSSLARYFAEYISQDSFFEAIQTSYRDRTAVLGYFNDFAKKYSETEFLKRLYLMTYRQEDVNIMVLDEVNIARIEYYFADFLSVMEYPMDKWRLKIMELPYDFKPPLHLEGGFVEIPRNTWFIGTANKDDSTYTITDKVYDRAITISFDNKNTPFEIEGEYQPIRLSYSQLTSLFEKAKEKAEGQMLKEDYDRFYELTDFVYDRFDVGFGNRILNQIDAFVPIFVESGGKKNEAIDFLFARKILSKLDGRLEDYIKQGLLDLKALIKKLYGEDGFAITNRYIDVLIKRL